MSIKDRMGYDPILKDLADTLSQLVKAVNALIVKNFSGSNPHKTNDVTNVLTVNAATILGVDAAIDASNDIRTKYEAHRASTTHHIAADSTNTVTATSVPAKIYALANELKVDLNAHMSDGTAHSNDDDVTPQVAAADANTKAKAVTLVNALRTAYEAHRVQLVDAGAAEVHGAADATNVVSLAALTETATWTEIAALVDAIRTAYEAHRVLTTDSVHAQADATNAVSATAVGTVSTALYALLNELKTDLNAHMVLMSSHAVKDDSMLVTAANAASTATAEALAKELITAYSDHITNADEIAAFPLIAEID